VKYIPSIIVVLLVIIISFNSWARPLKGFNQGPYLLAEGGVMQADFDYNQYSQLKVGHDFEPLVGIMFGWNIWDWFSAEIEGRYSTDKTAGLTREHLISANVNAKYFFITDALTDFPTLRIMPVVKGGFSFRIAVLPGDPNTTDRVVTGFGWGPSLGAGITFLWKKYLSFGIEAQEDFLFFDDTTQDLTAGGSSLPGTVIYKGGFKPQFSAIGYVGVHF
jgi:hypothetical protein